MGFCSHFSWLPQPKYTWQEWTSYNHQYKKHCSIYSTLQSQPDRLLGPLWPLIADSASPALEKTVDSACLIPCTGSTVLPLVKPYWQSASNHGSYKAHIHVANGQPVLWEGFVSMSSSLHHILNLRRECKEKTLCPMELNAILVQASTVYAS